MKTTLQVGQTVGLWKWSFVEFQPFHAHSGGYQLPGFYYDHGLLERQENRNWIGGETIKNTGKTVLANI